MRRPPWWLVALLVLLAFAFQGTRGIWEPDEGRYTAAGLNMLETGDWLVPTIDREHAHLTKPPVTYWAIATGIGLLGRNEWGARLPGALAFVGTGLLVFGLGRRFSAAKPWLPSRRRFRCLLAESPVLKHGLRRRARLRLREWSVFQLPPAPLV